MSAFVKFYKSKRGVLMPYDATVMADWQISEAAEEHMKSIWQLQEEMGLMKDEIIPYGRLGKAGLQEDYGQVAR